jgi:hypothetical protein
MAHRSCASRCIAATVQRKTSGPINGIQFQCGYDCSQPDNIFKDECKVFRDYKASPAMRETTIQAVTSYCMANQMANPKCWETVNADLTSYVPLVKAYCKGDALVRDITVCSSVCNTTTLNGQCDTNIKAFCAQTTNPARIKAVPQVCSLYMNDAFYNDVRA